MNNIGRAEFWEMQDMAKKLVSQANTLSAMYLSNGELRLGFGREVANYAKRVTRAVDRDEKTIEQGIKEIKLEYRHLLAQQTILIMDRTGLRGVGDANPGFGFAAILYPISFVGPYRLTSALREDPKRLLRFVLEDRRIAENSNKPTASQFAAPPAAPEKPLLFTPEIWPAEVEFHDPGFYIVPKSTTAQKLEAQLFKSPTPAVLSKFRVLNPGLDKVKAGQMIVLSDPENPQCTAQEARLMGAAQRVNDALAELSPDEADFMTRHRQEIETFLGHGATGIGVGESILANHLNEIKRLMQKIEDLHTRTFALHGNLRSAEFFAERQQLFRQLDNQLNSITKKGIGFPDHPKLKSALGISSQSLVHRWRRAGGYNINPGYATRIEAVAKAAKYVKYGGWIGPAIGGSVSYMKVQDVCAAGNAEACEKVKYTEGGGFIGSVAGGALAGAALSGTAAGSICVALGVPTAGVGAIACAIIVVGGSSLAAGLGVGKLGELAGEKIYEVKNE